MNKMIIYTVKTLIMILLYLNYVLGEEIGSPLKVAQCRASCVYTFTHRNEAFSPCLKKKDCFSCWKSCQQLQSSFNKLCSQNVKCGPGCAAACRFMDSGRGAQRAPVLVRRGEEVLMIKEQVTRWPAPAPELEGPWVYLVMRRLNNAWRQITQTLDLSAKIPQGGMVRVLVVGRDGLVTIYGPAEEIGLGEDKGWRLREVSVIHQEAVVIAEVAWEARHPRALYLVTWEVAGGGLRGNLLTSSTCVALSLWPDTLFHVQVELMNPGTSHPEKSEELVIDTHKGKEEGIILPEESQLKEDEITTVTSIIIERITNKTLNIENDKNKNNTNNISDVKGNETDRVEEQQDGSVQDGDILKRSALPTRHQVEAIAGISAAFAVFIVLLVWKWRNRCVTSPHVKLVEDEFLTSDLFKVVTHRGKDRQKTLLPLPQDAVT
ncbi:uncharacterized protein LOC142331542 [Lycorma delicatula]|uniref:uncharacterized protein LOC142331542 n=1 Tax=Lycorma delicatula TaxID=130591 RepID=UPI003F50F1A8